MASLKEIKGRIASVRSTLKTTSAMKLVASAKLRKAQTAIGNMVPYQQGLQRILLDLTAGAPLPPKAPEVPVPEVVSVPEGPVDPWEEVKPVPPQGVALVCFSSNSSLCGAFNANAIREATKAVREYEAAGKQVTVWSVGRKMADAMRRLGYPSPQDLTHLSGHPTYAEAADLAQALIEGFEEGRYATVELIYNHFKSTASQPTRREVYLPMSEDLTAVEPDRTRPDIPEQAAEGEEFIIEPDRQTQIDLLLPKVQRLKIYTVLLDTVAAEHAARTVAMQTATDNGEDLLQQLTLEYNKSRQAKITAEILDLEGGSLE
ncbi:MAG: ATP synthase F1 subunit gamma [Bacteroidales bacterium]|nr:ATP synthase F1 subunit gamma [Bacteroidales bacterium]